jgi:DNA-binding NarL/FixJ family response regulator
MIDPVAQNAWPAATMSIPAASAKSAESQLEEAPQPAVTVELSPAAQARLWKVEGQSVPEIAMRLRIDEETVNNYINYLI